ncbi:MAG: ATPase, T2SS/T4P/T4SS family [bacterium]|nr:ATPase, T2SS/T4P/T4SS family [bacterium]
MAEEEEDYVDLDALKIPPEVIAMLDRNIALEFHVVPVRFEDGVLVIARRHASPGRVEILVEDLSAILNCSVSDVIATDEAIDRALQKYYALDMSIPLALGPDDLPEKQTVRHEEDGIMVMPIVLDLLAQAVNARASQVIIESFRESGYWRAVSADGSTVVSGDIECMHARAIVDRFKIMAELHLEERQFPQDGHFEKMVDDHAVDIHVTTAPVLDGEIAALRIQYKEGW